MPKRPEIAIKELIEENERELLFPLILQQNPDIDKPIFQKRLSAMLKEGFRCIGAFHSKNTDTCNELVGCAGFWTGTRFWCGSFIEPDNVVVRHDYRRQGIGERLMQWIEQEGARLNREIIKLETYTDNISARAFYAQREYDEVGVVMAKSLQMSSLDWHQKLSAKSK